MRPIPADNLGHAHGLLRAIDSRGRVRTDEFVTEFSLEELFPPDLENALGRLRHFISYARAAGLVKEDRGVVELTDIGRRYIRAGDPEAPFAIGSQQAEWLRRQLREKHMTDSVFHGLAIGLSLLASCPPGARVSTLDFGRSTAYLGRAGWDNDNTLLIQGERHLVMLAHLELIDGDHRLTATGEQMRGELTLPIHMSLIDLAAQLNPGGPDAVRQAAEAEFATAPELAPPAEPEPSASETPADDDPGDENGYHTVIGSIPAVEPDEPRPPVVPRAEAPPPGDEPPPPAIDYTRRPSSPPPAASSPPPAAEPVAPPPAGDPAAPPPAASSPPPAASSPPPTADEPVAPPPVASPPPPAAEPVAPPPAASSPPAAAEPVAPPPVASPPPPAEPVVPPLAGEPTAPPPVASSPPPAAAPPQLVKSPTPAVAPGGATVVTGSRQPAFVEPGAIRAAAEAAGLRLPGGVYANVAAALGAGRHLLLTGGPGAGKTTLALAVTRAAAQSGRAHGATVVTGAPPRDRLIEAAGRGRWVIADELDQADLDAELGPLSTFLSGVPITIDQDEAAPADGWRIVGTFNGTAPKAAVLRRFAAIEVVAPEAEELGRLVRNAANGDASAIQAAERLKEAGVGTGVLIDAARHAAARNAAAPTDVETLAREVFAAYVATGP